jgi:hypothetical protein
MATRCEAGDVVDAGARRAGDADDADDDAMRCGRRRERWGDE